MSGTEVVELSDRTLIEGFLRSDLALHLYALGDLDDFFWPWTTWYGLMGSMGLRALVLLYGAVDPPVLLALEENDPPAARELLRRLLPSLAGSTPTSRRTSCRSWPAPAISSPTGCTSR